MSDRQQKRLYQLAYELYQRDPELLRKLIAYVKKANEHYQNNKRSLIDDNMTKQEREAVEEIQIEPSNNRRKRKKDEGSV